MSDSIKDILNGFAGRLILLLLTALTSLFSGIGVLYIKNLYTDLGEIKIQVSALTLNAKLVDSNKLSIGNYNQDQMALNEKFHTFDTRLIKLEQSLNNISDSLSRIERKSSSPRSE